MSDSRLWYYCHVTTLTIQQNISLPKTHFKNLGELREFVVAEMPDESMIRPEKLRQWERSSKAMDKGKGVRFTSAKAALDYLRNI